MTVHYDTVAGPLSATLVGHRGQGAEIAISLPLGGPSAPSGRSDEFASTFASAAGISVDDIEEVATFDGERSAIVRVKESVPLKDLKVNTAKLYPTIEHYCIATQMVGKSEHGVRINSRVFVEGVGIPEDPVVRIPIEGRAGTSGLTTDGIGSLPSSRILPSWACFAYRGRAC